MDKEDAFYEHEAVEKSDPTGWSDGAGEVRIPDSVFRPATEELSLGAMLLYGKIRDLSTKLGYCYAKNNYFVNLFDLSESTISKYIRHLEDNKYIEVEYDSTENGRMRKIYPLDVPGSEVRTGGKLRVEKDEEDALPPISDETLNEIKEIWNSAPFVRGPGEDSKPDNLPRIQKIDKDSKRYKNLQRRKQKDNFDFDKIVKLMEEQPFLFVDKGTLTEDTWGRARFDWLIKNNENYQKVLEKQYEDYRVDKAYETYKEAQQYDDMQGDEVDFNIAGGG